MDLNLAVTSTLLGPATARRPMQLESQHLVASALRLAGVQPRHPTLSGRKSKPGPDIFVDRLGIEYGVEVKRPESSKAVAARFDDGRDQLAAAGRIGAVAIDATDVLRGHRHEELVGAVNAMGKEVSDIVCPPPRAGYRSGYENIVCTLVFARGAWVRPDRTPGLLSLEHSAACAVYGVEDTILVGEWFQEAFGRGFEQTGFSQ
ncbi:MAG: hypothetical protein ACYCVL_14685 [Gemmatimonadaceae bacterium]